MSMLSVEEELSLSAGNFTFFKSDLKPRLDQVQSSSGVSSMVAPYH